MTTSSPTTTELTAMTHHLDPRFEAPRPHGFDVETKRRSEAQRYSRRNILRSEFMYGRGFQSPGGVEAVESFCARLDLRPGMRALEIGSGLGGSALYLAERHGVDVLGLDVAEAMIEISNERRLEAGLAGVDFRLGDIRTAALEAGSFDLAWTRDCVLYIAEKAAVWRQVARCLKPGGQLFVTDFARSAGPLSPGFQAYLDACSYHLETLDDYARGLAAAGLKVLVADDVTPEFVEGLEREKALLERRRDEFFGQFGQEDYDYLMERWDQKIAFCRGGDMKWGLFVARKE
jgi:phosphoethanolamine N-methyltransferase